MFVHEAQPCHGNYFVLVLTALLGSSQSEAVSVHFVLSKAKMDAESLRQSVWHGVAKCLRCHQGDRTHWVEKEE